MIDVTSPRPSAYGILMPIGILVSVSLWARVARRDERLVLVYVGALAGAFLGAKLVYLAAEGWMHWHDENRWVILATGKTVLGALLGGYAGVELTKKLVGYKGVTGDWFALIAPVGITLGRIGCWSHGCCLGKVCEPTWFTMADNQGIARWPAVPVEIAFNVTAMLALLVLRRLGKLAGQHFHLYLMAYGVFRFLHEWLRDTPQSFGALSGYQVAALAVAGLGLAGFMVRQRGQHAVPVSTASIT